MCELLIPADLPVQPDQGGKTRHEPGDDGDACNVTAQMRDVFNILAAQVSRKSGSFSRFQPSPDSGKFTQIAGRKAWVENPSNRQCATAFGAAEGIVVIAVTDETQRGVDPCETVVSLAEKVIPRTPEPYE